MWFLYPNTAQTKSGELKTSYSKSHDNLLQVATLFDLKIFISDPPPIHVLLLWYLHLTFAFCFLLLSASVRQVSPSQVSPSQKDVCLTTDIIEIYCNWSYKWKSKPCKSEDICQLTQTQNWKREHREQFSWSFYILEDAACLVSPLWCHCLVDVFISLLTAHIRRTRCLVLETPDGFIEKLANRWMFKGVLVRSSRPLVSVPCQNLLSLVLTVNIAALHPPWGFTGFC